MVCPKCNKEIENGSAFCSYCGQRIEKEKHRFCNQCGAKLDEGATICKACGKAINASIRDKIGLIGVFIFLILIICFSQCMDKQREKSAAETDYQISHLGPGRGGNNVTGNYEDPLNPPSSYYYDYGE